MTESSNMKNYVVVFGTAIEVKSLKLMTHEAVEHIGRSHSVLKEEKLEIPFDLTAPWTKARWCVENVTDMCYALSGVEYGTLSTWEERKRVWLQQLACATGFVGELSDWTLGDLVDATLA